MRAHRFVLCLMAGLLAVMPSGAAPHDTQAPGWFRIRMGDILVTALQDGVIQLPTASLQGVPPQTLRALVPHAMAPDMGRVPTSVNAYLVDTGAHRILVDAGNGDINCYGFKLGGLAANLKSAGYKPEDIDIVVLTHLHGDHVCGLMMNGKRLFAKAAVWIAAEEAAFWLDEKNTATPPGARQALALYGKAVHTFRKGDAIAPGMTVVPTPGHTPGHTAFRFQSGGTSLLIFGDLVHNHFVQFAHPEVSIGSDIDRAQAVATRNAAFAAAADEETLVAGSHLPFPGIGWLRRSGDGYDFLPVEFGPKP